MDSEREKLISILPKIFIFELNHHYLIDGKVRWNPARFINHSCNPNCDIEIENNEIWVISKNYLLCSHKFFTSIPEKSLISSTNFPDLLTIGTNSLFLSFTKTPGKLFFLDK